MLSKIRYGLICVAANTALQPTRKSGAAESSLRKSGQCFNHFFGRLAVASGASLLCVFCALADEAPSSGIVYNTRETNSLVYICKKIRDDLLDCEFTQTRVRKKAKAEDLKGRLDEARKAFQSNELTPELCKEQKDFAEALRSRKNGPNTEQQKYLKNISSMEKEGVLKILDAVTTACSAKTEESYLNVARVAFDKDVRTCVVSSNTYKQSLLLVLDPVSDVRSWVATGDPSGVCGIVQLSRFEPETLADSGLIFWKYIAKKAVTNRQGALMPGMPCKDLDEGEYIFDWRSKEHALGCDYIKFSPL